jgi:rubrerythrin
VSNKVSQQKCLTVAEILQKALERETQARDFYAELASSCGVSVVTEFMEKLQNEESKHIRMVKDMIGRLESGKGIT